MLFSTRETVASDTPARLATSRIVWGILWFSYERVPRTVASRASCPCNLLDGKTYHGLAGKAMRLDKADSLG